MVPLSPYTKSGNSGIKEDSKYSEPIKKRRVGSPKNTKQ
jgi:hypothetical protein